MLALRLALRNPLLLEIHVRRVTHTTGAPAGRALLCQEVGELLGLDVRRVGVRGARDVAHERGLGDGPRAEQRVDLAPKLIAAIVYLHRGIFIARQRDTE